MIDRVDSVTRSRIMAAVRAAHTQPELIVRSHLHRRGFRFRLHVRGMPGNPDIVFPKYDAVVFVHGCFWHRHPGCVFCTTPATRQEFWREKFEKNVERDQRNIRKLQEQGWRVFVVWECGLKHEREKVLKKLARGIKQKSCEGLELPETPPRVTKA